MTEPGIASEARVLSKLDEIRNVRRQIVAALSQVTAGQGSWKQTDDSWSLQEVIEHLVRAERLGFDLIWKAADAYRAGTPVWEGSSDNTGHTIEEIIQRTWKTREKAPPNAEPEGAWSLACAIAHFESCDALLQAMPAHLNGLPLERVIYPHFLSGPLDALQRLDFIRYHMQRHLLQIERIKEAQGLQ